MPKSNSKHCSVRKKLASGKVETYHYAYRGGPRILDKFNGKPLVPGTKAFKARLTELSGAITAETLVSKGPTIHSLIIQFKGDKVWYGSLATKTKVDYDFMLSKIDDKFGELSLKGVDEIGARSQFLGWRNSMAATPRRADMCWTMLKRLFHYALDLELIRANPCTKGGKLHANDRSDKVWLQPQLDAIRPHVSNQVWDAIELAIWTGQRKGDLLRLRWEDLDLDVITIEQSKSKRRGKPGVKVAIPVMATIKSILDRLPRTSEIILTNTRGKPWTVDGFDTVFLRAKALAAIADLHFHDLRGTTVLRLAESGCTVPEIAAITGHSIGSVQTIMDKYLPKTLALAKTAMAKVEKSHGFAIGLQSGG
jgi:integrase